MKTMNTMMRMMAVCMMATICMSLNAQRVGRGGNNNHSTVNVGRGGSHNSNHGSGFSFERSGNHGSSYNHHSNHNGNLGYGHGSSYGHRGNHGSHYGHHGGGNHNSNVNVIVNNTNVNNVSMGHGGYGHRVPAGWSHCMRHMDDGRWGYYRCGRWYYYNTYYEPDYYFAHPLTHFEAHCLGTTAVATATAVAVSALVTALMR